MVALGKDVSLIEERRRSRCSLGKRPEEPLAGWGEGFSPPWWEAGRGFYRGCRMWDVDAGWGMRDVGWGLCSWPGPAHISPRGLQQAPALLLTECLCWPRAGASKVPLPGATACLLLVRIHCRAAALHRFGSLSAGLKSSLRGMVFGS